MAGVSQVLLGREVELAVLAGLLDRSAGQLGGALVVRGEAGVGKSSLLAAAAADGEARGMWVLTATAFQAETDVPYAALHSIVKPLLKAEPESAAREVLTAALDGSKPMAPHQVARALLSLLTAQTRPLLVVVEDAQWLDQPSWVALGFVVRRLAADSVAVLIAMRDGSSTQRRLTGVPLEQLRLGPLAVGHARALLAQVAPGLSPSARDAVLDTSGGNPLAIVAFGGAVARSGPAALRPSTVDLTARIEQTFSDIVADLPDRTRVLLHIAALDDEDDLAEIVAAAGIVAEGLVAGDLAPAVAARLIETSGGRVRFRHPLLRSALRQTAPVDVRIRAHAAFAHLTAGSPDRCVWHRAAATVGQDDTVARDLAAAAERVGAQGALDTAVIALERAAALSESPADTGCYLVSAANWSTTRGDLQQVLRIVGQIDEEHLREADKVRLNWLREGYLGSGWSGDEQMAAFAAAADQLRQDGHPEMALNLMFSRATRLYFSNAGRHVVSLMLATLERLDVDANDPRLLHLLASLATVERGAIVLERLTALLAKPDHSPVHQFILAFAASAIGAYDLTMDYLQRATEGLRAQGDLGSLAQALVSQAFVAAQQADVNQVLVTATECRALALETGQPRWAVTVDLSRGQALALRGDTAAARQLADAGEAALLPAGAHPMLALVQLVRGTAGLADGRHSEAYDELHRIFNPTEIAYHPFTQLTALGLLAEAAVHCGRRDGLAAVVSDLGPRWELGRSPVLGHNLAYARALLAADDDADRLFSEALAADLTRWPFHRARLQLAYGAWLRRHRRPAESRPHLRGAATSFDVLGATRWADRARQELTASGGTLRRPDDRRVQLTPQELQVSQLAARGLSNNEIAELLFVSPRTVSTHIYRIFPKLGISSRAELARALQI